MRLTREQAAENKATVLDAALGLFQSRGFSDVGVSELMNAAGLTHGGFYNYFESKSDLEAQACGLAFDRAEHLSFTRQRERKLSDRLGHGPAGQQDEGDERKQGSHLLDISMRGRVIRS